MDKSQEIKDYIDFLIDSAELSAKQQEIIEENKRQQEVTVIQFRQAQEEIQRLKAENKKLRSEIEELEQITRDFESANSDLEDKIWELENDAE